VRHVPALEEAIRREEGDYGMHEDGGLAYVLIEDVVWPRLQRAAAEGPAAGRPYGALIAAMVDHGDEQARTLAGIGLLEQIDHDRPVREALVQAGYASLLDELG
jgi:hypothetical protein